jgi:hypothetical protein
MISSPKEGFEYEHTHTHDHRQSRQSSTAEQITEVTIAVCRTIETIQEWAR